MKKIYLLSALFILALPSCDSGGNSDASVAETFEQRVDAELQVHLDTFLREAAVRSIDLNQNRLDVLTMQFGPLDNNVLGTATTLNDTIADVVINENLRGVDVEFTAIHELGHAILHMDHRDDVLSIMNSFSTDAFLALRSDQENFDEFFQEQFFEAFTFSADEARFTEIEEIPPFFEALLNQE